MVEIATGSMAAMRGHDTPVRLAYAAATDSCTTGSSRPELGSSGASNTTSRHALVREVVEQYGPRLRLYLSRYLRSPDDTEDLLQELYCRITDYAALLEVESIKAFVFTIASNLLRDRARRSYTQAAKRSVSIDTLEIPVETTDPARIAADREDLDQASRIIKRLQPNCRKAFLLHRLEGLSYKEIALHMGVTVSMVEKHIIEALRQLRKGDFSY